MKNGHVDFMRPPAATAGRQPQGHFQDLDATELYCPKCGCAVPVNKFLLLVLPDGDRYEYQCKYCGTKVGDKTDCSGQFYQVLRG